MRFRRVGLSRRTFVAAVALLVVPVGACGADDNGSASSRTQAAVVKLAGAPLTSLLPVWVAEEKGYFREHRVKVENVPGAEDSPVGVPLVMSGKANVALITPTGLLQATQQGLPLQSVVGLTRVGTTAERDDSGLVARSASSINDLADLNDKTVALSSLKGSPEWTMRAAIDKAGGDAETVKFIQSPLSAMQGLLESGKVDAAAIPDPLLPAALAGKKLKLVERPNHVVNPGQPALLMFGKRDWVSDNADAVRRFRAAVEQAAAFIERPANRAEVYTIVGQQTKISSKFLHSVHLNEFDAHLTAADFTKALDLMKRYGGQQKSVDVQALLPPGGRS